MQRQDQRQDPVELLVAFVKQHHPTRKPCEMVRIESGWLHNAASSRTTSVPLLAYRPVSHDHGHVRWDSGFGDGSTGAACSRCPVSAGRACFACLPSLETK